MTSAQKRLRELRERQSKERGRMAELGMVDSLNDEQRQELDAIEKGTPDLERQIRAATVAVETEDSEQRTETTTHEPDAQQRERVELRSKAQLTNYLLAAAQGKLVSGAEAELCSAAGVTAGAIPIELWDTAETRAQGDDRETRDITPAPGTVGVNLDPIRPAIFANSIAARLGIDMPRVGSGTYATATVSTSQTAKAKAKSAAIDATAGALTVTTATPKRVSARLELALEDIAAVEQANFESILRENLSLALSDELDDQAINGDGSAPNLKGMFNILTDPDAPAAGVETFDRFVSIFAGGIDGLWANTVKDVGIVAGVDTYVLATKTFRDRVIDTGQRGGVSLGDESFADYAMRLYGGFWTNKRMPAKANHIQQGILYRKGRSAMGASAGMRTAVCPHWGEVGIDDIYSGSAKAERYFTMHVLLGDVILVQPDAYGQVSFRVSTCC